MTYKVEGLKQLEKAIELLGKNASKKVLKGALRDASKPTVKEVRNRIPRKTGAVRKSVGVKFTKKHELMIGYRLGKNYQGYIGRFLEKGTENHSINPSKYGQKLNSGKMRKGRRTGKKAVSFGGKAYRRVNVRGLKATPILEPALAATWKQSTELFKRRAYERMILETIKQSAKYK